MEEKEEGGEGGGMVSRKGRLSANMSTCRPHPGTYGTAGAANESTGALGSVHSISSSGPNFPRL